MTMLHKKLCLGTANFGFNYGILGNPKVNIHSIKEFLTLLEREGINTIDTALGYGDSEKVLGEIGGKISILSQNSHQYQ